MITIFNGRQLSLDGTEDIIYAQVSVVLRDKINCFNTGKSCNPFAVFMAIALHSDKDGWAWPGRSKLSSETGIKTAIGVSIKHLCKMTIDGHRVMACWRERRADGVFGRTLYRIFPDAWTECNYPDKFSKSTLVIWDPNEGQPYPDNPYMDNPHPNNRVHKKNQSQKEPKKETTPAASPSSIITAVDDVAETEALFPEAKPVQPRTKAEREAATAQSIQTFDANSRNGKDRSGVADPTKDNPWANGPLQAFCVLVHRKTLKDSEKEHWPRELAKWAKEWHATPEETVAAIKAAAQCEFNWQTYKTPFADGFKTTMDAMIDRLRNDMPIHAQGKKVDGTPTDPKRAERMAIYEAQQRRTTIAPDTIVFNEPPDTFADEPPPGWMPG